VYAQRMQAETTLSARQAEFETCFGTAVATDHSVHPRKLQINIRKNESIRRKYPVRAVRRFNMTLSTSELPGVDARTVAPGASMTIANVTNRTNFIVAVCILPQSVVCPMWISDYVEALDLQVLYSKNISVIVVLNTIPLAARTSIR
jgi:hypothetical protein